MATVKRRGSSWQATYRGPDGRERTKTFRLRVEAEGWVSDELSSLRQGTWIDPRAGLITFRTYAEQWRAVQVHRPSTAAQVETNLRLHAYPKIGNRPIGAIRPSEVQGWVHGLAETLGPSTVELVYRYAVAIFRAAVADRVIWQNPATGIRLPKAEPKRVEPLDTKVVQAIIEAVPDRYRALVVLAAGTGLRQGECFGLRLDKVDFLRRQLKVDGQLVLLPGAAPVLAPPKTQASYRTVPLPAVVLDALAAHVARYPVGPDGFLFTNDAGEPIRRTRFSEVWRSVVKATGAPAGTGFHALRHFYASLLIRHGESIKVVQARLGHASAAETLDTYSHLWPDSEDRTRTAVDSVLGTQATADFSRTSTPAP
jgi:integrase